LNPLKVAIAFVLASFLVLPAQAQLMHVRHLGNIAPDGSTTLPFAQGDSSGNQWIIYPGGWVRQGGPQPVFGQSDLLMVNGIPVGMNANFARVDNKTGEIVVSGLIGGGCSITRRILIDSPEGMVRFIDVFQNDQGQDQSLNVQLQSNLNFGVMNSTTIADPKRHGNQIAWVAMTGANRAAFEVYCGQGAKLTPSINNQPGNNIVQTNYQFDLKAGKSLAIMHLLGSAPSVDQGSQTILSINESKLLRSIPTSLRKQIANFSSGGQEFGNYDILRGDSFDVIELRSGDLLNGTLKEDSYKLNTFYGELDLPTDQVIALLNIGQYRPRQLVVTSDGQLFGGILDSQTISMELSSGQVVQVPLSQISRVGYRKRPDEPADWTFDKPTVIMRSGDRVFVDLPAAPVDVLTRYGLLHLDPQTIGSILFQTDDTAVHEIIMSDGSKFAGLAQAPEFEMKLASAFAAEPVKFPVSSLVSIQFASKIADADDTTPTLLLINQDSLVGTLVGTMKLDTAFDTLEINAPEVRKITHPSPGSPDVQITLWDNSVVSGILEEQDVQCNLLCGTQIDVPVSLLGEYDQPLPRPSASVIDKIKSLVADLSADDWKARDQAETSIESLGNSVISVLRDLRPDQPPEAQERIDAIIKQLSSGSGPGGAPAPAGYAPENP
jgi:hypothetical protein